MMALRLFTFATASTASSTRQSTANSRSQTIAIFRPRGILRRLAFARPSCRARGWSAALLAVASRSAVDGESFWPPIGPVGLDASEQDMLSTTLALDELARSEEHTSELQSLTNLVC